MPVPELPVRRGTYRLGIFGSMMDPPHLGHRAVVDAAHLACGLDRVVVVPAGIPPHREPPAVSARARLTMAVRAFADLDHVVVSDTEVERAEHGEVGYMVDTLEEMLDLPVVLGYEDLQVQLALIVGADQAGSLHGWHRFDRIAELADLVVVRRSDQLSDSGLDEAIASLRTQSRLQVDVVDMPLVPISSTLVRATAARGDRASVQDLVPAAIVGDVLQLYGE